MHTHSKSNYKIVRSILQHIADQKQQTYPQKQQTYPKIKKLFVTDLDMDTTMRFWQLLNEKYPTHQFTEVSCCPDCNKFELE